LSEREFAIMKDVFYHACWAVIFRCRGQATHLMLSFEGQRLAAKWAGHSDHPTDEFSLDDSMGAAKLEDGRNFIHELKQESNPNEARFHLVAHANQARVRHKFKRDAVTAIVHGDHAFAPIYPYFFYYHFGCHLNSLPTPT
jgi:hypothetical protein